MEKHAVRLTDEECTICGQTANRLKGSSHKVPRTPLQVDANGQCRTDRQVTCAQPARRKGVELSIVVTVGCETGRHAPKRGSLLKIAENGLGPMARQCLGKRRIDDLQALWTQVTALVDGRRHAPARGGPADEDRRRSPQARECLFGNPGSTEHWRGGSEELPPTRQASRVLRTFSLSGRP
ncbi:MAG: hypothetical protein OXH99_19815 [Bryobacterales bacterium]|nr:hypothetical protein [Bryobacterales bacterium]